jgi:hypothetical protein
MAINVYKLLHFVGILLVFTALGGQILFVWRGGTRDDAGARRTVAITHGVGLLLLLLGGFGMHARLGYTGFPFWFGAKVGVWAALGATMMVPWRYPHLARRLWIVVPLLGAVATALGVWKPTLGG